MEYNGMKPKTLTPKLARFRNNGYRVYKSHGFATKIYIGDTKQQSVEHLAKIAMYKRMFKKRMDKPLFTQPRSSTITINGMISNVAFNERSMVEKFIIDKDPYIHNMHCNFGKKGVKPTSKKKKVKATTRKRKKQGSGDDFSSQLTIAIWNSERDKYYNVKLFRNGAFQIPGVKKHTLFDALFPLKILCKHLRVLFNRQDINIVYMGSVMRNCVCKIMDSNYAILINNLISQLNAEKSGDRYINETLGQCELFQAFKRKWDIQQQVMSTREIHIRYIEKTCLDNDEDYPYENDIDDDSSYSDCDFDGKDTDEHEPHKEKDNFIDVIKGYVGEDDYDPMHIVEILNNNEQSSGLLVKMARPRPYKKNKTLTIKILPSGKINFDGGNSHLEIKEAYWWLQAFLAEHEKMLLIDKRTIDSDDESDCSCASIYDDDSDLDEKIL